MYYASAKCACGCSKLVTDEMALGPDISLSLLACWRLRGGVDCVALDFWRFLLKSY